MVRKSNPRFFGCIRHATFIMLRFCWKWVRVDIYLVFVYLLWRKLIFALFLSYRWRFPIRHRFSKQALVKKSLGEIPVFLLRSQFSSLSTQQKWTVEERNKTSKISPSFCTKKHLNPFSSLGERVVWSCVDGFKKVPKPKTHTSGLNGRMYSIGLLI